MNHRITAILLSLSLGCVPLAAAEQAGTEKKLDEKDVPKAVLATMHKAAGDAKLGEFEAETKKGKPVYTATFIDAKTKSEMEITTDTDGKLIGIEKEDGQADEAAPAVPAQDAPKK